MRSLSTFKPTLEHWLVTSADDTVLRWMFRALVVAAIGVVALDFSQLPEPKANAATSTPTPAALPQPNETPLPPARPGGDDVRRARPFTPDPALAKRMTFDLRDHGVLIATGTIMPGSAGEFADEIAKRGGYVKTVVLHSPGGSVQDALAIGRLIRERKLGTEVQDGRYCASSCPLAFAGGVERRAGKSAAIGVHQVYAAPDPNITAEIGMSQAQRVSAECQKYLRDMGVDPAVWIHAMETPKDKLFYLKSDELLNLKLATKVSSDVAEART